MSSDSAKRQRQPDEANIPYCCDQCGRRCRCCAAVSVTPFVGSWNPSAKAKAAGAPVKVDIGKLEPGQMVVEEWRGQAGVHILNRTEAQLAGTARASNSSLKDPDSDHLRAPSPPTSRASTDPSKPEMLVVVIGLCTHLGMRSQVSTRELGVSRI